MSEMLSRTRCAPRIGKRTLPRFILLLSSIACLLLTIEGFTTEWLMRNAFSDFLDKEIKKAFGQRMDALTGTRSLYDLLKEENEKQRGDVFTLVKMATRDIGKDDPGVQAILEAEKKVRGADRALAFLALSGAITFFLFSFVVYGAGKSRFAAANWLYEFFNGKDTAEQTAEGSMTPDLLSEIILDWAINSANTSDSLFFEIDAHVLAELCAIAGKSADTRLREEFTKRICRLCHTPVHVRYRRGDWKLNWEGIALVPAKGVEPGADGSYRLETNLTSSVAGHLLVNQLPRESYAVPLLCGPMVYELWKAIWDIRAANADKGKQLGECKCTLLRLLQDGGICFSQDNQRDSLDRLHKGLDSLRGHGFIEGWTITEGGRSSPASWYERVKLFHYDKEQGAYRLDRKLLERKTYRFWCGGISAPLPPPKPVIIKKPKKPKKKPAPPKEKVEPVIVITPPAPEDAPEPPPAAEPVPAPLAPEPETAPEPVVVIKEEEEPVFLSEPEVVEREKASPEEIKIVEVKEKPIPKPAPKQPAPEPPAPKAEEQWPPTLFDDETTCNDEQELIAAAVEYVEMGFQRKQRAVDVCPVSVTAAEEKVKEAPIPTKRTLVHPSRFAAYRRTSPYVTKKVNTSRRKRRRIKRKKGRRDTL